MPSLVSVEEKEGGRRGTETETESDRERDAERKTKIASERDWKMLCLGMKAGPGVGM